MKALSAIVFSVFFILGLYITATVAYDFYRALNSDNWPQTMGSVIDVGIDSASTKTHSGNASYSVYTAIITYEYEIKGLKYVSSRIGFASRQRGTNYKTAQDELKGLKAGDRVTVHYNPDNPADAVIVKKIGKDLILLLIVGVAFLAFGAIGLIKQKSRAI